MGLSPSAEPLTQKSVQARGEAASNLDARPASVIVPHPRNAPVNILMASSEATPFAKTGGLADVCGALPGELARLGHHVTLMIPAYRHVYQSGQPIEATDINLDIPIGAKVVTGHLLRSRLPDSDVPVYLVQQDDYFDRPELYREAGADYKDNCERFVFFCRSVMESVRLLQLRPDVLHAHDWQCGLIPAYLEIEYGIAPGFENAVSVLTIHNLAYQGQFWHWDMLLTGLDWKYFNWRQMEYYGDLNLLKTGIVFADAINTVSPRYAEEIQRAPLGCGMENVLTHRRDVLSGILNGVDYRHWNPATDPHLAMRFGPHDWPAGKAACKAALQRDLGLAVSRDTPLIGFVGRLAEQKGCDLIARMLEQRAAVAEMQWVFLGRGELEYQERFSQLAQQHPDRIAVRLDFDDRLAHQIEAGADMFLMPSRYEPCGLNQMYSLKYGTVPIVRETGGLADTIVDATAENIAAGTANGFTFLEYDAATLERTVTRACDTFRQRPEAWQQLVSAGMQQDWSWSRSARRYAELFAQAAARAKQPVSA